MLCEFECISGLLDGRFSLCYILILPRILSSFGQTLFSRFVKEMVVATDSNHDGKISMAEMRKMLKNIGVDSLVSDEDLKAVFDELGHEENGESLIYVDEVESILMQPSS